MQLAEGTVVAERFRLVRMLGEGGMGSVWFAHHIGLDIPCAVKFIHAEVASLPEIRARFEREAKAAAQLRSPNVVQVLDYGVSDGIPYIAMEFLEGEDLAHRVKRLQRLPPHEVASVISQVARALVKAHAAGLVHRDLKPENIFLVRDDDREIAKVLDFGIAKSQAPVMGDNATKTGSLLGTPHYMSPEQAQGTKAVDFRSDLWALAVIAYRCVTGRLPFESEALGDLLVQIIVNPVPVPSQVCPGVPRTFDAWWSRAAARDPAQRFQSAKELADSLAVALGISSQLGGPTSGQPYHAPGPTVVATPPSAAFHTPQPGWAPAGPTVPSDPSYPSVPGYPSSPGHASAPGFQSSPGATVASQGGPTPLPLQPGVPGTAATAIGHMSPSYPGPGVPMPGAVPHTTNPGVSRTFSGQMQPAPLPAGRGKLIAAISGAGLVVGVVIAFVALRGGARDVAPAASVAEIQLTPPTAVPPLPPDPAPSAEATATAAAAPTTAPIDPPAPPPRTTGKAPSSPPPTSTRPPVVPPPPPATTRSGKVVLPTPPPPPPPGKGKDFGF